MNENEVNIFKAQVIKLVFKVWIDNKKIEITKERKTFSMFVVMVVVVVEKQNPSSLFDIGLREKIHFIFCFDSFPSERQTEIGSVSSGWQSERNKYVIHDEKSS